MFIPFIYKLGDFTSVLLHIKRLHFEHRSGIYLRHCQYSHAAQFSDFLLRPAVLEAPIVQGDDLASRRKVRRGPEGELT